MVVSPTHRPPLKA